MLSRTQDFSDLTEDALTLRQLQAAMQLLTAPSIHDIKTAVVSLTRKYNEWWPGAINLKIDIDRLNTLADCEAISEIENIILEIDEKNAYEISTLLGAELINTCCSDTMKRAFKCLGTNLQELLESLDGVFCALKAPDDQRPTLNFSGFVSTGEGELIYISDRRIYAWLLLGSLKALSRILYQMEVTIQIELIENTSLSYRYVMKTTIAENECPVNREPTRDVMPERCVPLETLDLRLNSGTFCKAFPWHFILNNKLEIMQLGKGFSKHFKPYMTTRGRAITNYISFVKPSFTRLDIDAIIKRTNTPYLIALNFAIGRNEFPQKRLEIKGQIVHCTETDTLLFIGSPFIDGLEGLTCNGLYISDIPLHDATREVILVGEQARAQDGLRRRMDKLKNSIEDGNAAVIKERKKNVSLLHLIFPAEIAERLWLGISIDAQSYPNVTMLFSDIVGFTSICSRATPFMVISMLEGLYKEFDEFCGLFDVYKVETIGDAYCVASGLHRPSVFDAHKVSWMALKMICACAQHSTHDGEHIKIRIGLHTGTVLAGIVGRKMPRYCLFGHNVAIANKFESGSEACKINVSPTTREWLIKHSAFEFRLEARDPKFLPKEFSESGTCFFLKSYQDPNLDDTSNLNDHISHSMKKISLMNIQTLA